jgi:hypothetical protein
MAMDGKERAQRLRDKEKAGGIEKLLMKLTATERSWISEAQKLGKYEDHTELILFLIRGYIEGHRKDHK